MRIRPERAGDVAQIRTVVTEAMRLLPQASGTEAEIIERLRAEGALRLGLVAEEAGAVVGYLAASEARIGVESGWGLIGPLAVTPARHRQGIGQALMRGALARLRRRCKGAVLVGDPGYYARFGFRAGAGLTVGACPPRFILALPFGAEPPAGEVYHPPAFGLRQEG